MDAAQHGGDRDDDDSNTTTNSNARAPWTAFLAAIENGDTVESIRTLVAGFEGPILRETRSGTNDDHHDGSYYCYALHYAASSRNVRPDVLQYIIDAHPPALRIQNDMGHLPLHCAILNRLHVSQIRVLVEAWKPSLREYTASGYLPLHLTVRDREDEGFEEEDTTNNRRRGPYDYSSLEVSAFPVIKYLVDEWSDALIGRTTKGRRPQDEGVRRLAEGGSGKGLLPLHVAIIAAGDAAWNNNNDDVVTRTTHRIVQYMIDQRPETIRMRTGDGRIAIHVAINELADISILELLVNRDPASIRTPTRTGYLPLHLAFVWHDGSKYETYHSGCGVRPPSTVKFLVDRWPGALQVPEPKYGYLPAHLALAPADDKYDMHERHDENGSESIRYLLEAWPGATQVHARMNGYTVLHCAVLAGETLDVIQCIVEHNPSAVKHKCHEGRLPIHLFLYLWPGQRRRHGYNEEKEASAFMVIKYLIEQWPESTTEQDEDGYMPIHLACEAEMSFEVIEWLVTQSPPEALLDGNNRQGYLPVHMLATRHKANLPLIQLLVTKAPQSLRKKSVKGSLALHLVISQSKDPAVIDLMIQACPESLREANEDGYLPIHWALDRRLPLHVLRAIFDPWRDAARVATQEGYLPVHLASANGTPIEFLHDVLDAHPQSVRQVTGRGWLPVHYATLSSNDPIPGKPFRPEEARESFGPAWPPQEHYPTDSPLDPSAQIDLMLEKWPDSLMETTPEGWTVLHLLCRNSQTPASLIDRLCGLHSSMISAATAEGYVPLHVAIMNGLSSDAIGRLLLLGPGAVRAVTTEGWVPLHLAMAYGAPEDQVRLLVNEWPASVEARTTNGRMLALHVGSAGKASMDSIRVLLQQSPESIQATAEGGLVAAHFCAQRDATDGRGRWLIRYIVEQWPESVDATTTDGLLPLHFAVTRRISGLSQSLGRVDLRNMVEFLADQRPESLVTATRDGWIPLHFAAVDAATVGVVRVLIDRRPDTALARTRDGQIPLHLAASKLRHDVVNCLLQHSPTESVRAVDNRGRLPLHEVADRSDDTSPYIDVRQLMDTAEALVELWPESVRQLDNRHRLPLHLAAMSECPVELLFYLIKAYPESILPMATASAAERSLEDVSTAESATMMAGDGRRRPAEPSSPTEQQQQTKKRVLSPTST